MMAIAIGCGILLLILWLGFCVCILVSSIREREPVGIGMGSFFLLMTIGFGSAILASEQAENSNPCIAWGAPVTTMQMVGKAVMPVTHTPCIQRQNETER